MKLFVAALVTVAIGWAVVLAAPKPASGKYANRAAARRAKAEQICKSQGETCRLVVRPDAPRDLTGAACVCEETRD
jgi:hypothetical protein